MLTLAYASLGSIPQERFITLSTVGADMKTSSLYPASNAFIKMGDTLDWNVQLYNHMGEAEYVAVRVKLLNATEAGPDGLQNLPSPAGTIYEERVALAKGASATLPLAINLKDIELMKGNSAMKTLTINGVEVSGIDVANVDSDTFRFVIELWRFDVKSESFVFSWTSGLESESAWNQIRIQVK